MDKSNGLKAYMRVFRPYTLVTPLAGGIVGTITGFYALSNSFTPYDLVIMALVALTLAASNAMGNALNEYSDTVADSINKPNRPIVSGTVHPEAVIGIAFVTYFLSVALAFLIRPIFAFFIIAINIGAVMYSLKPFRLKAKLYWGNFAIGTPRGLLGLWSAWVATGAPIFDHRILLFSLMLGVFVYFANIVKDLGDIEGDKADNIRNFATVFGINKAAAISLNGYFWPPILAVVAVIVGFVPFKYIGMSLLQGFMALQIYTVYNDPMKKWKGENTVLWRNFYLIFSAYVISFLIIYFI